ncbi:MAG: hypothetical protein PHS88_08555 [Candidatus Omnitrophica bacterium]|nr:hypothetical protein [Candidatus Omnitrophota bacterium]
MNWKVILSCYLAVFVTFLIYFLPMLYAGQVFGDNGRIHRFRLIGHCFVLLFLFAYATILASKILIAKEATVLAKAPLQAPQPSPEVPLAVQIGKEIPQEKIADQNTPDIDIKIYPSPLEAMSSYKYPLKSYILTMRNLGGKSSSIFYFKAEFVFPNIIAEVKPLETAITEESYFDVERESDGMRINNTNVAVFTCARWPENMEFGGQIIVDLSKIPVKPKEPDKIGQFHGDCHYKINDKIFSVKVNGAILPPADLEKEKSKAPRETQTDLNKKAEEEARQKAQREAEIRIAEDAKRKAAEDERQRIEEETRRKIQEDARKKAEEETKRKSEEVYAQKVAEDAKRKEEDEARKKGAEEAKKKFEEEVQKKVQEELQKKTAEEASRKRLFEEAERQATAEAQRKAEEEAKRKAEEGARKKAFETPAQKPAEEPKQPVREETIREFKEKILPRLNTEEGTIGYTITGDRWLERDGNYVEIIPRMTRDDFEIHVYRDSDNIFKVVISTAFCKNALLKYPDLEKIKQNENHPKHHIAITWGNGRIFLYIDGEVVDLFTANE